MAYYIQLPDGRNVEFPDDYPRNQAQSVAARMASEGQRPAEEAPQPQPRGSNMGFVGDLIGSGISGAGGIGTSLGGAAGIATGNFDTGIMRLGRRVQQYGESLMSPELLQSRERLEQDIRAAGERGMGAEAMAAARGMFSDPRLIPSYLAEQVPQVIGSLGLGRAAGAVGQYAARRAGAEAAETAGRRAAVGTAVGTSTGLQTGEVARSTYEEIMNLAPEVLERSENYQNLRRTMTDQDAREALALRGSREAAAIAAPISAGTAALFGVERFALGDQIKRRAIGRVVLGAIGEAGQEATEEAGGQFGQNVGVSRADVDRDLSQGVGGAAARGAILGGIMGGGIGLVGGRAPDPSTRGEDVELRGALDPFLSSIRRTPGNEALSDQVRFVTENLPVTAEQFAAATPKDQEIILARAQREAEGRQADYSRPAMDNRGRPISPDPEEAPEEAAGRPSGETASSQSGSRAQSFQFEPGRAEMADGEKTQAEVLRQRAEELQNLTRRFPQIATDQVRDQATGKMRLLNAGERREMGLRLLQEEAGKTPEAENLLRAAKSSQIPPPGTSAERTARAAQGERASQDPLSPFFPLVEGYIQQHIRRYGPSAPISIPAFQAYVSERTGRVMPLAQAREVLRTYNDPAPQTKREEPTAWDAPARAINPRARSKERNDQPVFSSPAPGKGFILDEGGRPTAPRGPTTDEDGRPAFRSRQQDLSSLSAPAPADPTGFVEGTNQPGLSPSPDGTGTDNRRSDAPTPPTAPLRASPSGFTDPRLRELSAREAGAEAEAATAERAEAPQPDKALDRARAIVMDRLDKISKRGAQGKKVREAIVKAMKDGRFDAGQIYSAIMAGEQISSILPAGASHDINFVNLLTADKKGAKASGNEKAQQAQGERVRPEGEINKGRFNQLMREGMTADQAYAAVQRDAVNGIITLSLAPNQLPFLRETAAHEAFHVLQDYYGKYDPQFAKLMSQSFRDGMMITDIDPTIRRKLEQTAHPAARDSNGNPVSYWQVLTTSIPEALTAREAQAYAFGSLVDASRRGTPMSGLKPAFARFVNFLRQFFTRMGNAFRGDGFQTPESLLGRAARGDARRFDDRATPTEKDFPKAPSAELSARQVPEDRGDRRPTRELSARTSSVSLRQNPPEIKGTSASGGKITVKDVGEYFDRVNGRKDPNDPAAMQDAIDSALEEVRYQLSQEDTGEKWYEESVAEAFAMTQSVIPELADVDHRRLFSAYAAVLSNGTRAGANWENAAYGYQEFLKTGQFPEQRPGKGTGWTGLRSGITAQQIRMLNTLLKRNEFSNDPIGGLTNWLLTTHPVSEIQSFRNDTGIFKGNLASVGALKDERMGAYILGPKFGPFMLNINGIEDTTTDSWFTRTFNRHFGRMTGPGAVGEAGLVDAPRSPAERKLMKDVFTAALAEKTGKTDQAIQAILWYYEQQLFYAMGVKSARSESFSDGAKKFIGSKPRQAGRASPQGAARGDARGAKGQGDSSQAGAGPRPAAQQDVSGPEEGLTAKGASAPETTDRQVELSARATNLSVPEFTNWWNGGWNPNGARGQSVVVNPDGSPKVMYHGTQKGFKAFGKARSGSYGQDGPFFFSTEPDFASDYALNAMYAGARDKKVESGQRMLPVYLSAQNPFKSTDEARQQELLDHINRGFDDETISWRDIVTRDDLELYEKRLKGGRYTEAQATRDAYKTFKVVLEDDHNNWPAIETPAAQQYIRGQGYDGFYVIEDDALNVAVYDPRQIKSIFNSFERGAAREREFSARNVDAIGTRVGTATPEDIRNKQFEIQYTQTSELMNRGLRKIPFIGGKVKDTTSEDLIILMQDRMLPLGRMVDAVRKNGGTVVDASDIYMTEELYHGRAGAALDERAKTLYKPVFDAMKRLNVTPKDVDEYLEARHAPERNDFVRSINEDKSKGAGITNQEAAAIMKRLAPQKAKLDEVAKLVDAIVADTNKTRFTNGLTPDYSTLNSKTKFKYYVPLRGFAEEDIFNDKGVEALRARTGQGFKIKGKEDRSITGRQSRASNILGNVILQNEEAVIRAEKNRVGQALLKMIRDNPTETAGFARILEKAPVEPRIVNGKVKLVSNGMYKNRDDVMVVKEGGSEVAVEIYDERLAKALTGASGLGAENTSVILNAMGKLNRYLAQVNTTLNPEFVISNFARDLQTANINIKQYDVKGMGRKIISDVPSALAGARAVIRGGDTSGRWAKAFEDFRNAGGTTEYLGMRDIDGKIKQINEEVSGNKGPLVARPFKTMIKLIEDYNSVAENGIRLSTFQALRDMGVSDAKAAQVAKNLTVNFNKAGQNRVLMNSLYLFYNASIQGSMAMVNAMARSPRVRKYVAGIITAGVMHDVINSMMSGMDDDERKIYDKIPEHVLERNYVLMDPFGLTERGYYAFPMPYGFNAFFNMGRNLARVSRGEGDTMKTGTSILMGFVEAFNPMGGTQSWLNFVSPTITDPLVDLATNRNFANRPISPDDRGFGPPTPDSQRFWSNTFPPYVTIAQWLNQITGGTNVLPGAVDISPNTIGYLMNYATGAAGAFAERVAKFGFSTVPDALTGDLEEFEVRDVPFVRKLYGNVTRRNNLEDFMENSNRIAQIQKEFTEAERFGQGERMMQTIQEYPRELAVAPIIEGLIRERQKITREMSQIRRDPNLDDQTRRDMLRVLGQQSDLFVGQVNRIYNTQVRQ